MIDDINNGQRRGGTLTVRIDGFDKIAIRPAIGDVGIGEVSARKAAEDAGVRTAADQGAINVVARRFRGRRPSQLGRAVLENGGEIRWDRGQAAVSRCRLKFVSPDIDRAANDSGVTIAVDDERRIAIGAGIDAGRVGLQMKIPSGLIDE